MTLLFFFFKQYVEFIMSKEKTMEDEIDERRMKICAIHKCAEMTIVIESIIYL